MIPFARLLARDTGVTGGFPEELRPSLRTLEAYGRGRRLLGQEYVADAKFEPALEKLFGRDEVDYIQVHSTTAGCFTFRIERSDRQVTRAGQEPAGQLSAGTMRPAVTSI